MNTPGFKLLARSIFGAVRLGEEVIDVNGEPGHTASGLRLSDDLVLSFVDETGHDTFHDAAHPVFGWAGCAMTLSDYTSVANAWSDMKAGYFAGVRVMHAADLRRPTIEQLGALETFFRTQPFSRFAAVTRRDARIEPPVLNTLAGATAKQLEEVLRWLPFSRVATIFEAGAVWDEKVARMFGPMEVICDGKRLPVEKYRMAKTLAEPGLEIADFVANAVGGSARERSVSRKDFRAVFDVDGRRTSVIRIESALVVTDR